MTIQNLTITEKENTLTLQFTNLTNQSANYWKAVYIGQALYYIENNYSNYGLIEISLIKQMTTDLFISLEDYNGEQPYLLVKYNEQWYKKTWNGECLTKYLLDEYPIVFTKLEE